MDFEILLRDVTVEDLPIFFEQQLDPFANWMAAFTSANPIDRDAFQAHWTKILADDRIVHQTILCDGLVAGHVLCYEHLGRPEVTYWVGREYWGRGVATRALTLFLQQLRTRPLYARAAKDNLASCRVLAKCGFTIIGEDRGFSNARGTEVDEYVLELEAAAITRKNRAIQFVSDKLVEQIVEGRKTASVVRLGEVDVADGDYDDPLVVGETYDVYDSSLRIRAAIRIVGMELCRWDAIPERLWRGETNANADEFRLDHADYFANPPSDFEFVAYYFQLAALS